MDWIRQNTKLATIIGIFSAAAIGLGVYLYMSNTSYMASLEEMKSLGTKVASMEKAPLYPNEKNVNELEEKVNAFESEVDRLSGVLLRLQPPVKTITDTDFQSKLKQRIAEVKTQAANITQLPKDFAFGFDVYTQSLPRSPEAAKELGDFFDAVDAVVMAAINSGVRSIDSLERSELIVEKSTPPPAPKPVQEKPKSTFGKKKDKGKGKVVTPPKEVAKVVERRQLKLTFTADQRGIQSLANTLASASDMPFFTVLRVARIENEAQEGPRRGPSPIAGDTPIGPGPRNSPAPEPAPTEPAPDGTAPPAQPKAEVLEVLKAAPPDATAVMGAEALKAYFEIDIIRFVEPTPETAAN